ncbi:MAG: LysR substrate-binding domain-containing protein [Polaromonas sp.]|jgi:LysR family glycine cleavage system transcriptional activator
MKRLQPPLHLLKAFITTARFASVSRASEALHLSQSAVSKQIAELEAMTGALLFERIRKRLVLSPAGMRYEAAIKPVLAQLEAATLELITSGDGGGALHLSSLPTFGAKCLIPRLPAFQKLHPQIALHFVPYVQGYDFTRADLDCSILFGDGNWPGTVAEYIAGHEMALIAPPSPPSQRIKSAQDLQGKTLLHHVSVPQAWAQWASVHGVKNFNPLAGPQLDQFHSLIRAVMAGMGVALVPYCLVKDDIAAGLVSLPLKVGCYGGYLADTGYYLCYPEARSHLLPLTHFKTWLLAAD